MASATSEVAASDLTDDRLDREISGTEVGLAIAFVTRIGSPDGLYIVDEQTLTALGHMDSWYRPQAERLAVLLNELDRRRR